MPSVLNIAHRGARSLAPENTLLAARRAVAVGAGCWELDVALSADDELIVIHDDTLTRTSNAQEIFPDRAPWKVADFTLEELRRLDFGGWFVVQDPFGQIAAGVVSSEEQRRCVGERIPTLREALAITRDLRIQVNVEIKDQTGIPGASTLVERVVRLVDEAGLAASTLISSFNHDYIVQSKALSPEIATGALVDTQPADTLRLLRETGANALNPRADRIDPRLVPELIAAGYAVYPWTVNEEQDLRTVLSFGVTGIITDFPQRLHRILSS